MSRRRQRVMRLSEIVDRQELTARAVMARSENELRAAVTTKNRSSERTEKTLQQELPHGFRQALLLASTRIGEQQDQVIEQCQTQAEGDHTIWLEQRLRSGSIAKLLDRIIRRERLAADRSDERELADIISSRTALALARDIAAVPAAPMPAAPVLAAPVLAAPVLAAPVKLLGDPS